MLVDSLRSVHIESLDVNSSVEAQLFVTSLSQSQSLGVNGPLTFQLEILWNSKENNEYFESFIGGDKVCNFQ